MKTTLTVLAALGVLGGVALAQGVPSPMSGKPEMTSMPPDVTPPRTATTDILGAGGKKLGTATLTEGPSGVLIRVALSAGALKPGWHGMHIHEKADCSAATFTSAGAHVGHGLDGKMHGLLNPRGAEMGDLPSLFAPASGAISTEVFSPFVTLGATAVGARAALFDADGSALVIHALPDDQTTQPIGGAGDRVACAALKG